MAVEALPEESHMTPTTFPMIGQDPRPIDRILFGVAQGDLSIAVGHAGVTHIVAYEESDGTPFFAVFVAGHLNDRVPAKMVIVTYKEPA